MPAGIRPVVQDTLMKATCGQSQLLLTSETTDCGAQSGAANAYANPWGNDAAMTAITNAKTYLLTTLGANGSTKIGFLDYSLGGGQGFNWMSRNASGASGVISYAPAVDYDYHYANNPTTNSEYAAELELSYSTATRTLSGTGTVNQVGSTITVTTDTTPFPASGNFVLYAATDQNTYMNVLNTTNGACLKGTHTGKGAATLERVHGGRRIAVLERWRELRLQPHRSLGWVRDE